MNLDPGQTFAHLFVVGADILATTLDGQTKTIRAQLGNSTDGTVVSQSVEWWQHAGFASRPAKATKGGTSCQAIAIRTNDHDVIVATRDTRGTGIYGNLKDGETCVYAAGSQARTIYKADGSITHLTTSDNTPNGTTIAETLGPDGYHLTTPFGGLSIDATGVTLTAGQAAITLSPAGIAKVLGQQVEVQGQIALVAGQIATCIGPAAAPTPGVLGPTSAVHGPTGVAGAGSSNVFISP